MLIPIILCGGSGSRLWPLSRTLHPKPFLELPLTSPATISGGSGPGENLGREYASRPPQDSPPQPSTLLGGTYARLAGADLELGAVITVCGAEYAFLCEEIYAAHGPKCAHIVLAEPLGRNTAPAIAMASGLVRHRFGAEAILLALPADHRIANPEEFWKCARQAIAEAHSGSIVLFGIKAQTPATGYGYIECAAAPAKSKDISPIRRFVEKPDRARAVEYIERGFYWNCGIFCFTASTIERELAEHAGDIAHRAKALLQKIELGENSSPRIMLDEKTYAEFPSISLDHAVIEKTRRAMMVKSENLHWSDIGSWNSFAELLPADADGNHVHGDAELIDSGDCMVIGGERIIALVGLRNTCVVDSPDALLICARESAERTGEVFSRLRERSHLATQTPRKVRRPWGAYTVLAAGNGWQLKLIEVEAKSRLSLQSHKHRSEHWTTVSGTMTIVLGDRTFDMGKDESCHVPAETRHRMINNTEVPAAVIELQLGTYLGEDDITRYEDMYGRA